MQEPLYIKKIAVLGAGVMGAQIAAHCINSGFKTLLFDLPAKEGPLNSIVNKAILNLTKLKPSPLGVADNAALITACNYEENLNELSECDLIIEAIAERLDWKEELYKKISPYLTEKSILVSNTSGLSINTLAHNLPEIHQERFCGVHFFNPPRYMHLVELVPAKSTSPELLNNLETWLTSHLGKGVVRAKDTPNFIANRIGVFSLLVTLYHADRLNIGLDTVDALTGALLGRPKSATFRTMDVVGLDTMEHVVHTMREELRDDPWHQYFNLPDWLVTLIQNGKLGQKTGEGIYRKAGKNIEVYDPKTGDYRPSNPSLSEEVREIFKIKNSKERMELLFNSNSDEAKLLALCFRDLFHYTAFHLEDIADTVRDVDLALCFGFGWTDGPFETWQKAGVSDITKMLARDISENNTLSEVHLPQWLSNLDDFYTKDGAYCPLEHTYKKHSDLPVYKKQFFPEFVVKEHKFQSETLFENDGVRLWNLKDNVVVASFKTKANCIGQSVLSGMNQALDYAEKHNRGLIIYQEDKNNFSAGADLKSVGELISQNKFNVIEKMIEDFQNLVMRFKYCPIPVVAALRGKAFGGGCEILLHCDATVAAFESYPGLVELGVGLIPAGGGCTQMALRAASLAKYSDVMTFIRPYFQQIATAFVAGSGEQAIEKNYLKPSDHYVMHVDEVLYAALSKVNELYESNYTPPIASKFKVGGLEGRAQLQLGLVNYLEGKFISEHDYNIANALAHVICGGEVNANTEVDEKWILKLEREAFIKLTQNPLTQARIAHILQTGKPLRN